jgi:hypothetical protein
LEAPVLPIRVVSPGQEEAERLLAVLEEFPARVNTENGRHEVEIVLDGSTSKLLLKLFETIGTWVASGQDSSCQVYFGDRAYTLLATHDGKPSDPSQFLLERTIQLQIALDTRVVIEQAKGILAERHQLPIDKAFELLRRSPRNKRRNIHDLAREVVDSPETPADLQEQLDRR